MFKSEVQTEACLSEGEERSSDAPSWWKQKNTHGYLELCIYFQISISCYQVIYIYFNSTERSAERMSVIY